MPSNVLEQVGTFFSPDPFPLLLEPGKPLSQLWVDMPRGRVHAARALAEARGDHLRRRLPVLLEQPPAAAATELRTTLISPVFLAFGNLAYFDHEQVLALGPGVTRTEDEFTVGQLQIRPVFRLTKHGEAPMPLDRFWASEWRYSDGRELQEDWWRVWPQGARQNVRDDFVAAVSRHQWDLLGRPRYVIVEHPEGERMRLPALLTPDKPGTELNVPRYATRRIVALDASCRDALGIMDGEFCRMVAWKGQHLSRRAQRRFVGARTIVAHVKIAARVDLEKPVCRLGDDALTAIGARAEDTVIIEAIAPSNRGFGRRKLALRALPIDPTEAAARATWERARGTDGWIDPAAFHGINPPYPPLYLDYPAREYLGVVPASPVVVRTSLRARLASDASDFLWLAVAGVIAAAIHFGWLPAGAAAALLSATVILLAALRIRRAVR